jgi:hypothetical protein
LLDQVLHTGDATWQVVLEFMLPEPDDLEPNLPQPDVISFITFKVGLDFGCPEWAVCLGDVPTLGAAMPEATIDEYGHSAFEKNEIWVAWKPDRVKLPAAYPRPDESELEAYLSSSIVTAAHCAQVF